MEEYWKQQICHFGRKVLFVDTGAIIGAYDHTDSQFTELFEALIDYRLITSTYVVTETVRQIVKTARHGRLRGPAGEQKAQLALHFLQSWLQEKNVHVLCIPEEVYDAAKTNYRDRCGIQCDLTDIISWTIVKGLEQEQIVACDSHFIQLGLRCLP